MRSAFVDIIKSRGVRGLYNGLTPTLVEIVPYAGLQFGTYDMFKRWMMVKININYLFCVVFLKQSVYFCHLMFSLGLEQVHVILQRPNKRGHKPF